MTSTQYSLFVEAGSGARLGEYDEMVSGDGRIRQPWRALIGSLQAVPEGVLSERVERIYRQYQDTALAYSVDNDRQSTEVRRPFDIIPLVLSEDEWRALETGLAQRARLLDRLIDDLYGERRVIANGLLPPALIYGNPRFLRPCAGIPAPRRGARLHAYSADLLRRADGSWAVVTDRTQAPAGIGFALQNRGILARTLPELFRSQAVRRIEPFFELWREGLAALSPRRDGAPRIVVLTPGPFNAAYFEHVYLARQLDATLVEGADLTVRDGKAYVKTLGSLHQVDVILRFLEDDYCDPLELRGNSVLGAAGLLQAVREGNVVIANALGASVVETPALREFLPALAEALLGETLLLPSVESSWLGSRQAMADLPDRLNDAIIRPAYATAREERSFHALYQEAGRNALLEEVRARPRSYVVEPRLIRSVMPIWTPGGMLPRPLTLRIFVAERDGSYFAMPGGLAQVPHVPTSGITLLEPVFASKDSWILAGDGSDATMASRPAHGVVPVSHAPEELRSRSADDLFWLGRYTERLDNAARMMRSALARTVFDQIGPGQQQELHILIRILSEVGLVDPQTAEWLPDATALRRAIVQASSQDKKLKSVFRAIQRIAQSLRDRLSNDMWQVVVVLMRGAQERLDGETRDADGLIAALDHLVGVIAAFGGMASENMTRGTGWRFVDIGRRIERGAYGVAVLRNILLARGAELEIGLGLALELFDSSITYRSRYLSAVQLDPVIELVLADESNPRGLVYQLLMLVDHLGALVAALDRDSKPAEQALVDIAAQTLGQVSALTQIGDHGEMSLRRVVDRLDFTRDRLHHLSDAITHAYFSQVQMPHAVGYEGI
jgi:uncharacterized circularly permuted ATP-grasp superfamily protein/uncharacterized alpha-E superfamily protein